jgi:hypothetical protein
VRVARHASLNRQIASLLSGMDVFLSTAYHAKLGISILPAAVTEPGARVVPMRS